MGRAGRRQRVAGQITTGGCQFGPYQSAVQFGSLPAIEKDSPDIPVLPEEGDKIIGHDRFHCNRLIQTARSDTAVRHIPQGHTAITQTG